MYIPCFTLPSTWHSIQYIVFKIIVWAFINGSWSWHRDFDREPVTSLHEAHKTLEGTCDFVRCKQSFERYICKHIYEVHELSFTKLGWFFMYVDPSQSFKKIYMQTFLSKSALTNVVQRFFFFCNMMYVCRRILHEVLTYPLWILFEPAPYGSYISSWGCSRHHGTLQQCHQTHTKTTPLRVSCSYVRSIHYELMLTHSKQQQIIHQKLMEHWEILLFTC